MAIVSLTPYFKAKEGKLAEVKALIPSLCELIEKEPKCVYVGFSFNGDTMLVREGYEGAAGIFEHLENAGPHFGPLFEASDLVKLEVVGPAEELDQLKDALKDLNPTYYVLEAGK